MFVSGFFSATINIWQRFETGVSCFKVYERLTTTSLQLDPIDDLCVISVIKRENNTFGPIIWVEWNAQ